MFSALLFNTWSNLPSAFARSLFEYTDEGVSGKSAWIKSNGVLLLESMIRELINPFVVPLGSSVSSKKSDGFADGWFPFLP